MPEPSEIAAYEFGIRITQTLCLLEQSEARPDSDAEAALSRLQTACDQFRAYRDETALSRFGKYLDSCHDDLLGGVRVDATEENAGLVKQRLTNARNDLTAFLNRAFPAESRWSRLGLLIADGADATHSAGKPTLVPREYPKRLAAEHRLPYLMLEFVDPVGRRWDFQDEAAVMSLISELNTELDQLFDRDRAIRGEESQILRELPSEFWGWHAIEFGLESIARQRVKPRWDDAARNLYLGHSLIHHYKNPATNQTQILQAFEQNAWCNPIECPFADGQTTSQTVLDLNKRTKPSGLKFQGGTQGMRWEQSPPTSQ